MRVLVAGHLGHPVSAEPIALPAGAALVDGGVAWVYISGRAASSLGPALAWALRHDATALELIADTDMGLLARRAESFGFPVRVWSSDDRAIVRALPEPLAPFQRPIAEHLTFRELIESAGADPSVEHGVVAGEVRGLEVCRVVDRPTWGNLVDGDDAWLAESPPAGGLQLEVGIGAADREAFQLLHGDIPTVDALADVVRSVSSHRSDGAPPHPLNRLARERYLRWQAIADPALVGMSTLDVVEPPVPRANLSDTVPCSASGTGIGGRRALVVFSSGVDLDLVPYLADAAAAHVDRPDDLVVALPERDLLPVTELLAAALAQPVRFVAID